MKEESPVIADQHAAVNMCLSPVHTARHSSEVGLLKVRLLILFFSKQKEVLMFVESVTEMKS
jgi:hypothetical protein